jgi:hypothetical protein
MSGDGMIGISSFRQIAHPKSGRTDDVSSDVALAGAITGMHVVQDRRTSEQLLVGGADDGSIAFWALK